MHRPLKGTPLGDWRPSTCVQGWPPLTVMVKPRKGLLFTKCFHIHHPLMPLTACLWGGRAGTTLQLNLRQSKIMCSTSPRGLTPSVGAICPMHPTCPLVQSLSRPPFTASFRYMGILLPRSLPGSSVSQGRSPCHWPSQSLWSWVPGQKSGD